MNGKCKEMVDKKSNKQLVILVACRKFDGVIGGVERMSTTLMNELVARGHEVHLFTWDDNENAKSFYHMDQSIGWTKLAMGNPKKKAGWILRMRRALKVRTFLKTLSPDVVLGFQEGSFVTLKLYGIGLHIPMICAIRESPFRYAYIKAFPPFWLSCLVMRLAAAVTVQFERYKDAFPKSLEHKLKVTPNHIAQARNLADPVGESSTRKTILCTGRLSYEKNHDALIKAFALIAADYPDWTLDIVGSGSERQKLQNLKDSLDPEISGRVILQGPTENVSAHLERAQIFCLPSRWEGFPNSLAEAMAHGLPVIGYEECDGVCDLIEDGVTGLLAEGNGDISSLSQKLSTLMGQPELRKEYGNAAFEKSKQYHFKAMSDNWENILIEAAGS